jgi:hypothetical protein
MSIPTSKQDLRRYSKHRSDVFRRDGYRCVYCESTMRLVLDHVIPLSRGGSNDASNLVACCEPCNSEKGALTPDEWLTSDLLNPALLLPIGLLTPPPAKGCITHPEQGKSLSFQGWHSELCGMDKYRAFVLSILINWKGQYAPTIWEIDDAILGFASEKPLRSAIWWLESRGIAAVRGSRTARRVLLNNENLLAEIEAKWPQSGGEEG